VILPSCQTVRIEVCTVRSFATSHLVAFPEGGVPVATAAGVAFRATRTAPESVVCESSERGW